MNDGKIEEVDEAIDKLQTEIREAIESGKQENVVSLFAQCQGAEVLVELFLARKAFPECGADAVIRRCCARSSAREAYTFLLEVISHGDLSWDSKLAGLPHLRSALLRMEGETQKQFLFNALAVVPKLFENSDAPNTLDRLGAFGVGFTEAALHLEDETVGCIALEDGLACYLFNLLQKLLPRVGPYPNPTASFDDCPAFVDVIASIARLARRFMHSPPAYPYRETEGDGGGASEAAPLGHAAFIYLTETYQLGPPWARVARVLSPQRRYLFLAWVGVVMAKGGYLNIAFQVFMEHIVPLLPLVTEPILDHTFYATFLEGLAQVPEHQFKPAEDTRAKIFSAWSVCIRTLPFRRRFDTYLHMINNIKIDVLVGGVVTNARTDWWNYLQSNKETGNQEPALRYLALQLVDCTLNGKMTIVDGMDTLVAALNFVRLLLMSDKCKFVLMELCGHQDVSYFNTPLDKLLQNISNQVDYELTTAQNDAVKERIDMVAHLVARVRELIPAEEAIKEGNN